MGLVKEAKRWSIASLYNQCGTGRDYVLITGFWNYIRCAIEIWSPVNDNAFILDSCWLIILNIQQNTMDVVSLKFDFWRNLLEIESKQYLLLEIQSRKFLLLEIQSRKFLQNSNLNEIIASGMIFLNIIFIDIFSLQFFVQHLNNWGKKDFKLTAFLKPWYGFIFIGWLATFLGEKLSFCEKSDPPFSLPFLFIKNSKTTYQKHHIHVNIQNLKKVLYFQ